MYDNGEGVPQDFDEAVKWCQLAAVQGNEDALKVLDILQQDKLFQPPPPPPGTAVTVILLTTGKAAKLNNKITGAVVAAPSPAMVRPGIAFVLLHGEEHPKS